MNVEKIVKKLEKLYPEGKIILNKNEGGEVKEVVCELIMMPEFSKAIAVIDRAEPHYHKIMTEIYNVLEGELSVSIDDEITKLSPGKNIVIKPGQIHFGFGDEVWIEVFCFPGWKMEDHILVDQKD